MARFTREAILRAINDPTYFSGKNGGPVCYPCARETSTPAVIGELSFLSVYPTKNTVLEVRRANVETATFVSLKVVTEREIVDAGGAGLTAGFALQRLFRTQDIPGASSGNSRIGLQRGSVVSAAGGRTLIANGSTVMQLVAADPVVLFGDDDFRSHAMLLAANPNVAFNGSFTCREWPYDSNNDSEL